MNILLAFKAEPDLAMLGEADWQAAVRSDSRPDPALMRVAMGHDEQGAAELMLKVRDARPDLILSAVTLGDERALPALRHLAALGFSSLTLLECHQDTRFAPAWVAQRLAEQVQRSDAGLVLLGSQSSEGQNAQTGWLLAEILGWPCLSQVCGLSADDAGFNVECESLRQRSRWRVQRPAVLIVQNRGQLALRVPGMRARLAAAKADVARVDCDLAVTAPFTCLALERKITRRAGIIIEEPTPQAAASRLWEAYLAQRRPL